MTTITISRIVHRNQKRIRLQFASEARINRILKSITGARWSRTLKCWHLPDSDSLYHDFKKMIPPGCILREITNGEAKTTVIPAIENEMPAWQPRLPVAKTYQPEKIVGWMISQENMQALEEMTKKLLLKAYSESTIRTYRYEFSALLQLLKQRLVSSLTSEEVKRYVLYCINDLQLRENSVHSRLNALKFYFEQVLGRDKIFVEIPRPKKHLILPKVLGEKEIGRLFSSLENKKHKAILFTAYSAGLRVSEAVNLKINDIDADRMQIFVEKAKGKKDRYVMLSPVLLDILRNYLKDCRPRPVKYLFEGNIPGEAISSRTAQNIFLEAKHRAGLRKNLTFHSLRHSFATHLLEKGVDIKYIKDLLGHFNITTTTRYLHVKREMLVNITSPLDDIFRSAPLDF